MFIKKKILLYFNLGNNFSLYLNYNIIITIVSLSVNVLRLMLEYPKQDRKLNNFNVIVDFKGGSKINLYNIYLNIIFGKYLYRISE